MRGPLFDLAVAESGDAGHFIPCPLPMEGDAQRAGGCPKVKESEANLPRCATSFQRKEGEVVKNHFLPFVEGGMLAEDERE